MATIEEIDAKDVKNLTGIEFATSLSKLTLGVSVPSALLFSERYAGKAKSPEVDGNLLSHLTPLAGLTTLNHLVISSDALSDLKPLAGLTELTSLELYGDSLSDLKPLAGLTELTSLELCGDSLSDLKPLAGLTELTRLGALR